MYKNIGEGIRQRLMGKSVGEYWMEYSELMQDSDAFICKSEDAMVLRRSGSSFTADNVLRRVPDGYATNHMTILIVIPSFLSYLFISIVSGNTIQRGPI